MSEVNITVDDKLLMQAMNKAPGKVKSGIKGWIKTTAYDVERSMKLNLRSKVSIGSSGRTLSSIGTKLSDMQAEVKPSAKNAIYTEQGRRPGKMPPYQIGSDLANWSRRVGAVPFLAARSIGRKGTKGKKFVEAAYKEVKPKAERDAQKMLSDVVRSI